jgi:hypothetical protein
MIIRTPHPLKGEAEFGLLGRDVPPTAKPEALDSVIAKAL